MRNALAIAVRELEEKRFVLYAALAFAVLPFLIAVIPGINTRSRLDAIVTTSFILATGFTVGLAFITGTSFIGRDLSDGRMSFYFSRPVSSLSIWFGKLTAGILMIVGCFGFIIGPARLFAGQNWDRVFPATLGEATTYVLPAALGLFLIAHVIGTFARSRSHLIAFDFAAAVICGIAILLMARSLAIGLAFILIKWLGYFLLAALIVGMAGGGAWQLERGRTDRRRNHLALSQFLWGTMAAALLLTAAYVTWVVSVKLTDLGSGIRATASTSGPFAVITGKTRGRADYQSGFLLNTEDGSSTRIDGSAEWGVRYTRDGRSAVVPHMEGAFADVLIYRQGAKKPIDTGLTVAHGDFFVSDDGGRIATLSNQNILSVYDVAQKRSLASVLLPFSGFSQGFFVTPDVLRLYFVAAGGLKIAELDVRAPGVHETGLLASTNSVLFYTDPSAEHVLVRERRADGVTLNDARTGALITTLAHGTNVRTARYLRDGRIAFIDGPGSTAVLHILSPAGVPERDVPLGPARWTMIIGDDGTRGVLSADTGGGHQTLFAINLNRGVIERRESIGVWVPSGRWDIRPPIEPLREVFYSDAKGIQTWNPATGAKKMITGG